MTQGGIETFKFYFIHFLSGFTVGKSLDGILPILCDQLMTLAIFVNFVKEREIQLPL